MNCSSIEESIAAELEAELLTGKQLNLDNARAAALKGDMVTLAEELNAQNITADFHVWLGNTSSVEEIKMRETKYWKWLYNRGLRDEPLANKRLGQAEIGQIDFRKTFNNEVPNLVQQNINGYNNIYAIILDDYKSTYEWLMSEEEIDIQQHA